MFLQAEGYGAENVHPDTVLKVCESLGCTDSDQLTQLAESMKGVNASVLRRHTQHIIDMPADFTGTTSVDIRNSILADVNNYGPGTTISFLDGDAEYITVSRREVQAIALACPFTDMQYRKIFRDCEDFMRMVRGWLSYIGVGNLAIGGALVNAVNDRDEALPDLGHALAIIKPNDGPSFYWETQNKRFHDGKSGSGIMGAAGIKLYQAEF